MAAFSDDTQLRNYTWFKATFLATIPIVQTTKVIVFQLR